MAIKSSLAQSIALLLGTLKLTNSQDNSSSPGPPWVEVDYRTSPEVLPQPYATGSGWEAAFSQAAAFVSQLTLEEKATLVTGTQGPCVGNIGSIPRLGFEGLCLQDGPLSIRAADYASVFPAGLTVAASWDRKLARLRGQDIGTEFKEKGAHVILGPVAGPLGRSAYGGRNWEGFSPEPYLTGVLFEETILGHQERGVQACAKHYILNEQETQRNPGLNQDNITIEAVSSNVDDRTIHELYLWPFANAVRGGVASIMCSYNRINGTYGCDNSKTLNGLLKLELGFPGWVVSDWGGTHSGHTAINAGQDMDMPGGLSFTDISGNSFFGGNITTNVNNGSLTIERVNDMARRIMTPYFHLKQETQYPPIDGSTPDLQGDSVADYKYNFTLGPSNVDVRDQHAQHIRELGAAGIVLLKNVNGTLPLDKPANIGVFGNAAADIADGLYSAGNQDLGNIGYDYGVLPVGGGSGTGRLTYVVSPLEAIKTRAAQQGNKPLVQYVLNNTLVTNSNGYGILFPRPPDVCLVFLKTWSTEGYDRTSLLVNWNGTALVETVASQCPNTVVVTNSGGLNVLPFANHPNVTAILAAHYGGQEQGNSIADVLYGDVNPSGKLPYTIAHEEDDYQFADITNSSALLNTSDTNAWQSDFKERLLIDYRHFDFYNLSVAYEFGFGLSYTTFAIGNVAVSKMDNSTISSAPPEAAIVPGGNPHLWTTLYQVTATVTNTGSRSGAAVAQLYLSLPQPPNGDVTPVKVLRGFEKIFLEAGASANVTFDLARRDISYWDTYSQQWLIGAGDIGALVGFSSRDIRGNVSFTPLG
ncbi:glycoside hydrolase family 3 protein [Cercospora zeae-maydis SCOH1-5]|uniref:Probable beta-glucosidase G n=1 Tax=Cercospora zeae-maydis SCOH1-5 TaxID=717836 RepID=A0A6A6FQP3_9PEZI|nr:glycoside hydrolase family 3 protein [Cercospora zeae-maydis SCOH1-5]